MTTDELYSLAKAALQDPAAPLPGPEAFGSMAPLAGLVNELLQANRILRADRDAAFDYIRRKIDQLLLVIGTVPLRPEELDDQTLVALDPVGIIADSFTQILEHLRQTNEERELAAEEIQAIFEAMGGGVQVVDRDMRILAYNDKFAKMFGVANSQAKGRRCSELTCKGHEPRGCCPFAEMLATDKPVTVPDWSCGGKHYSVIATPVRDAAGQIVRGVMLYLDITELMAAKVAVAEEKERLATTLASIAEGVIATDAKGAVTLMNLMAERLTGFSFEEVRGRQVCEVLHIVEEHSGKSCSAWLNAMVDATVAEDRPGHTLLVARDGNQRVVTISAAPIAGQDSAMVGAIIVFRDITKEKRLEEELFKNTRLDSLGLLAGGIAHDFNNLLAGILGNVGLAKMDADQASPLCEHLTQAERACLRARDLTGQLLAFAKGGEPIKRVIAPAGLIRENVAFALRGAKVKGEIVIPEDLWDVEVDGGQIAQVLNNLVINANQAMPRGGTVTVTAANVAVNVLDALPVEAGNYITIAVADSGIGIPPEHLDRIFEPYFTTKQAGSGLGLASSFTILKRHGGLLDVASELGKGTTFTVYLPATSKERPPKVVGQVALAMPLTGKVLVMDDDEAIRSFVERLLGRYGFEVGLAADGQQAIALYQEAKAHDVPYDLVVMDLTVPGGMGGQEAMARLLALDPGVKGIVSSGYSTDAVMASFKDNGFQAVIPKPYDVRTLMQTIQDVLTGSTV